MAVSKRVNRKELADQLRQSNDNNCPQCRSDNIAGLMQSFFVKLSDGEPAGQWRDWESNSELGPQRSCGDCGHEWEADA